MKIISDAEAEIRTLLEGRVQAILAKDLDGIVAPNGVDVVTFDVLPPLRNLGDHGIRERAAKWLGSYADGPHYEIRDLEVVAGDDVAVAWYLYRVSGKLKTGGEVNMWVRCTVGLQRNAGSWEIVHEHDSVPFDAETGKASLDLKP